MPQPQPLPKTRQQLFDTIASAIGWGATAGDVAAVALRLEAQGIEFVPAALLPEGFVNPFRAKKT
jgi:hypothetical protein